ncbi:unnamed protein product [Clonostachys rosea]|uniref:Aldehyde dehydrogenase domain-containing protein n=1 Tax=Bionectria ochroleuca TaxID=29856 RepID=A0ABY6UD02_BIOOC|nr:unnamed protein product [Clonostachys rosea]
MATTLNQDLNAPNGAKYTQPLGLFINNEWRAAKSDNTIQVISPSTEEEIARVHAAGVEDIDDAVKAARQALRGHWSDLSGTQRGGLMWRLADLAEKHTEAMAGIDTWNNAWKLGPALAAGCTVILKPSDNTPLSILYFANLIKEAGFPPGVINITNGLGSVAGAALASHMDVNKVAFTGSTATGREIMKLAANDLKSVTLETGGKSPLVVFEDADFEQAVNWSHYGIMANQGQICTATSWIMVQQSIDDKFVAAFVERVKAISKVGDPFADDTFQGPQVSRSQYERVLPYIEKGKQEGATVSFGGKPYGSSTGKGFFIEPTVFTNVTDEMTIYREEIFGPCVVISSFQTEEEVIYRANNTTYGLGAATFTQNITRAHAVAKKVEAGMVWTNSSNDSDYRIPFGGYKESGIGSELGEEGLAAYTTNKAVHVNIGSRL